jgi:hypothetical protein
MSPRVQWLACLGALILLALMAYVGGSREEQPNGARVAPEVLRPVESPPQEAIPATDVLPAAQLRQPLQSVALGIPTGDLVLRFVLSLDDPRSPDRIGWEFLRGRVLDAMGNPVASVACGEVNEARIVGLTLGEYWFAGDGMRQVKIQHSSNLTTASIPVGHSVCRIRVVDAYDSLIEGARVHIYSGDYAQEAGVVAAREGVVYAPEALQRRGYVSASSTGLAESDLVIVATDVTIRLTEPSHTLNGVLENMEGGTVAGRYVRLRGALRAFGSDGQRLPGFRVVLTDALGRFEFQGLRARRVEQLFVEDAGDYSLVAQFAIRKDGMVVNLSMTDGAQVPIDPPSATLKVKARTPSDR